MKNKLHTQLKTRFQNDTEILPYTENILALKKLLTK